MKTEDQAWRDLQARASAQLRPGFADRALRAARGPQAATWRQLHSHASRQLRPGFAERVLRAARAATDVPTLSSHFALSAATAVICLCAVVFLQERSSRLADERNLADWEKIVLAASDLDVMQ